MEMVFCMGVKSAVYASSPGSPSSGAQIPCSAQVRSSAAKPIAASICAPPAKVVVNFGK